MYRGLAAGSNPAEPANSLGGGMERIAVLQSINNGAAIATQMCELGLLGFMHMGSKSVAVVPPSSIQVSQSWQPRKNATNIGPL